MRAYERLLKYVKIHTTSDPNSGTHPSTLRQFDPVSYTHLTLPTNSRV